MPINVTCPECLFAFAVADEYAGQQGRCPECAAVIRVPGGSPEPRNPYASPYPALPDVPPLRARSTPSTPPPPPSRERPPRPQPTFDAQARAARWLKVANGYRNLMLAAVLNVFGWGLMVAYFSTAGVEKFQQNQVDEGSRAVELGLYAATAIALVFWTLGRMAGRTTPYVPARMMSMAASVCAMLGGGASVFGLVGMAVGALLSRDNLQAGVTIVALSMMGVMFGMVGVFIGEFFGLLSQMKIAEALRANSFNVLSKVVMAFFLMATLGMMFCGCMLMLVVSAEEQRQQQQALAKEKEKPKQGIKDGDQPAKGNGIGEEQPNRPPVVEPKEPPAVAPKQEGKNAKPIDKPKDKPKNANPPDGKVDDAAKQDDPEKKNADDEANEPEPDPAKARTAFIVVLSIMFLGMLFISALYFQCARVGRRAILQEVDRLVGKDDPDQHHNYEG